MSKEIDKAETVCEELRIYMGLNVRVVARSIIECDTIAGIMKYQCSEKTVMGDVYRFISHYGSKLHKYGLENKLKHA